VDSGSERVERAAPCVCGAAKTAEAAVELDRSLMNGVGYCTPHKDLLDLVQLPPNPTLAISPNRKKILQLTRPPPFPPISEFARPEEKLAGLKIDGAAFSRSRGGYYTDMALFDIDQVLPVSENGDNRLKGLPENMWINSVSYSRMGSRIAFTVRSPGGPTDPPRSASELWIVDLETRMARPVLKDAPCRLNTIFQEYQWLDEDTLVACCLPKNLGTVPTRPVAPSGPVVQDNSDAKEAPTRTFQDLLKDEHDEDLFEYYCTSELIVIDVVSGTELHRSPPALYTGFSGSPDSEFLLVSWMERPFSFAVPCGRFPKRIQLWKRDLSVVKEIAYLPLAEGIPTPFDSVRKGPRSIRWRPDKDAELCWVETQDEGDPENDVNPRDIVYTLDVTSADSPTVLATTQLRFTGISFCEGDLALVNERWWNTKRSVTTIIEPDNLAAKPKVLFDRSYEDVYNDPGYPIVQRTARGTYILAKINGERKLLLNGEGASPRGSFPFLDILDIDSGEKERIWQSAAPYYETFVSLFNDDQDHVISKDNLTVMLSRETMQDVPQFRLVTFANGKESHSRVMTHFPHPYPHMKDVKKEIVRYKRKDGVDLTATLYTPVGYDKERDGPLPCIMWVYPYSFKSKDAAGQLRKSPYEFVSLGSMTPKLWLARNYAVFDGPSMPIIAEGEDEPNDTYIEQLIANAEAAVDEVVRRGVAKRESIAVGGHSYGAFTVANLLAHSPDLFVCGIGRSGAYNRTLTPFGFQSEQRTMWQAPETYMKMSPFTVADKIKKPLLLIHGKDDTNIGTHTMQSERFYAALRAHGAPCRLVLLPYEGHGYRAEESVMHCLYEMDVWLNRYCT